MMLSRPATALVVATVGDSAVLVADRTVVSGVDAAGVLRFGVDAPRIVVRDGVVAGFAGQVGYGSHDQHVDLRDQVATALSSQDPRASVRRTFEAHSDGMCASPYRGPVAVDDGAWPTATIAVVVREFESAAELDVVGLTDDGLARAESLAPFGGGALAPRGPMLDALRHELAHRQPTATPEHVVASLAAAIYASLPYTDGLVAPVLDAAIVTPGSAPQCFVVPYLW